jgi:hypothetical protein
MIKDNLKVSGNLSIKLYDENGQIKNSKEIPNLVVTVGKNWIVSRMQSNTSPVMSHMSVGTGTVDPELTNVILGNEIGKVALANSGGYAVANTVTYDATFPPGTGTGAITEAGIFNASAANTGTMLCRTNFGVVTKAALDTLSISWVVSVS